MVKENLNPERSLRKKMHQGSWETFQNAVPKKSSFDRAPLPKRVACITEAEVGSSGTLKEGKRGRTVRMSIKNTISPPIRRKGPTHELVCRTFFHLLLE